MAVKEDIVILKSARTNRDGDVVTPAREIPVRGCKVWPRTNEEDEVVIEGLNVWIPKGQPVPEADDVVRARGGEYEVIATPGVFAGKGALMTLSKAGATHASA
jgi:hypothetical protein